MADTQASAFGDIPALDLTNDRIPILDVGAVGNDKNKLISPTNLMVSKLDLAGGTMTGALTLPNAIFSGLSLTGSQATSALAIAATWNTTGAPALIYGRVTNTASGAASYLLDLGTSSRLVTIHKDGTLGLNDNNGIMAVSGYTVFTNGRSASIYRAGVADSMFVLGSGGVIRWESYVSQGTAIATIRCAANNIVDVVNGTNPQKLRVYGTTTGSKYLQLEHEGDTGSGLGIISTSTGILELRGASGTRLGENGTSLVGFYGVTPVDRAAVGGTSAAYGGGTTNIIYEDSTIGGYTLAEVVGALQDIGILT